jgi:hypothetical protein
MKTKLQFRNPVKVVITYPNGESEVLEEIFNGMTDEGRAYAIGVALNNVTPEAAWYIGMISSTDFSHLDSSDTLASHEGWVEEVGYSETERPLWEPTVDGNSLVNTAAATFTFPVETTLSGILVASDPTKGGLTGTLWSTALFSGDRTIPANSSLHVTYQVEAS